MAGELDASGVGGGTVQAAIVENNPGAAASTAEALNTNNTTVDREGRNVERMEDDNSSNEQLSTDFDEYSSSYEYARSSGTSINSEEAKTIKLENGLAGTLHAAGLWQRHEIDYYSQRYRFGIIDPYGQIANCREYLFFTKPDLNIYPRSDKSDKTGIPSDNLNDVLKNRDYWLELAENHFPVLCCLQDSLNLYSKGSRTAIPDHFNHLLENCVASNLEIPGLSSDYIETPNNTYGVNIQYHGSSEASNDNFDFSLEFRDTKDLGVYHFFRAYEDYQTLKHHGIIEPWIYHIIDKVLYDQYSIYKFIVDEDGERILYYAKFFGVTSKSLPRDTFSNTNFDDGITYNIEFHAAFFEDMNPTILKDFNAISRPYYTSLPYRIDIHNDILDRPDNRPAKAALVVEVDDEATRAHYGGKIYKLKWRGDAKY